MPHHEYWLPKKKERERERNTQAVLLNVVEKQYKIVRRLSMGQIFVAS